MPILTWALHAEEGILRSGVAVDTMINSMSFGSSPAEAIASSPARAARSEVNSSGAAMCRWRIPKVSTTHAEEVGRFASTSCLGRLGRIQDQRRHRVDVQNRSQLLAELQRQLLQQCPAAARPD